MREAPAASRRGPAGHRFHSLARDPAASGVGMTVRVRRAVPGDEAILRALRLEAMLDSPAAFGSTYAREQARTIEDWQRWMSPGVTFLLYDRDHPRGLVAGSWENHQKDDDRLVYLMAMWVHPTLRGTGAADALVASVLAWAAEQSAREVRLYIRKGNDPARRCYERHGFRVTGRENVPGADGFTEVEMTLLRGA